MPDIDVTTRFAQLRITEHPDNAETIGVLIDCALGFAAGHFEKFRDFSTGAMTGDTNPDPRIARLFASLSTDAMVELLNARARSYK